MKFPTKLRSAVVALGVAMTMLFAITPPSEARVYADAGSESTDLICHTYDSYVDSDTGEDHENHIYIIIEGTWADDFREANGGGQCAQFQFNGNKFRYYAHCKDEVDLCEKPLDAPSEDWNPLAYEVDDSDGKNDDGDPHHCITLDPASEDVDGDPETIYIIDGPFNSCYSTIH